MPLTVKPQKYYDADSGKPIGEEYWVLDADGQEVCCMDEEEEARRIVAAVNACEGIPTELLEQGAGFWKKSNLHDEERDAAFSDWAGFWRRLLKQPSA